MGLDEIWGDCHIDLDKICGDWNIDYDSNIGGFCQLEPNHKGKHRYTILIEWD